MNLKKCLASFLILFIFSVSQTFASSSLEGMLKSEKLSNNDLGKIKSFLNDNPKNTIKSFLAIIKDDNYPDRSRWLSLVLISKSMGKKSIPLLKKYLTHPKWIIRSAAVKSLKSLGISDLDKEYKNLLKDSSYVIREQVLDTISTFKIKNLGNDVLKMLGDKTNYIKTKKGMVPSEVIKKIISTLVKLEKKEAIPVLAKISKSEVGKSIKPELQLALNTLSKVN